MRSVFFGTPQIAVPALQALHRSSELVGVVCQPDRPKGRGLALAAPEVKVAALELGVPVYQPLKVKDGALQSWLEALHADVAVVLAYGRILPQGVLDAPKHGCLNLHASLLPRYRGAAPIQWALMHGEAETGVSLMQMDAGLDTGPVFSQQRCSIPPNMNHEQLSAALSELAARVVLEDLPRALNGELRALPQDASLATHAPPLTREHGVMDWSRSARDLCNQVRALSPRPGATAQVAGKRLRILATEVVSETSKVEPAPGAEVGRIVQAAGDHVWVTTGDGLLRILQAQLEGKRVASARELVNGRTLQQGLRFESQITAP